jgi:hypothetical protein
LVEVCPWNLFDYSEGFNASYWNKRSGTTITADTTTAPNGTLSADTATKTSGDGYIWADLTLLPSTTYTISLYAKGSANLYFNAYWGTGSSTGSAITLTSDWQRLSFSFTTGSTTSLGDFGFFISATCFIWGAQLNIGATAKPYFPTTDRLNVPRLTYQNGGGGCPSLLLEKQSTNLVTYSEQFDQWNTQDASVTANQITSPDGTQNADKIVENNQNQAHYIYSNTGTYASADYTVSVYAKAGERSILQLLFNGSTNINAFANFDLTNGVAYPTSSTATITAVGNGWYRCTITATLAAATLPLVYFAIQTSTSATRAQAYAGNGTSGLYLWGAQSEQSSYVTSLIQTTSASATRVADGPVNLSTTQTLTNFTLFWDGLIFENGNNMFFGSGSLAWYVDIDGATGRVVLDLSSGRIYTGFNVRITTNQRFKLAIKRSAGVVNAFVNGIKLTPNTQVTDTTSLTLSSITWSANSTYYPKMKVNEICAFQSALSDADCQALTTL